MEKPFCGAPIQARSVLDYSVGILAGVPRRRSASEYAVDLGCHDEVVLMQALDLLGQRQDRRIAPTEADIRMMAFREFSS